MLNPEANHATSGRRTGTGTVSVETPPRGARASVRSRTARLLVLDALVAVLAAEIGVLAGRHPQPVSDLLLLVAVPGGVAGAWLLALGLTGGYDPLGLGGEDLTRRVGGAAVGLLALLGVSAIPGLGESLRSSLAIAVSLAALLTLAARRASGARLGDDGRCGGGALRVLVVGARPDVEAAVTAVRKGRTAGVEVVGACLPETGPWPDTCAGVPVIAHLHDAAAAAQAVGATLLVAAGLAGAPADLRRLAWQLEGTGCRFAVAIPATDVADHRLAVRSIGGAPVVTIREPVLSGAVRVLKDVVERTAALLLAVVLSPLLLACAVAVRLGGGGSVLFRQVRMGRGARPFTILKFRTMHDGADQADVLHLNEVGGPLFKIREDPRVTGVGRWLRRYSLDELPQLWNVVNGTMSLVGPRPPLPREVACYTPDARRRLLVKPGMTGLWQVSGRADLPWEETLRLDLYYVDNWSLILDAGIVARTFSAVALGRGAY
ncbi:MAG TPA: sugar transferase [Candidatus Dormibacteraeota bacterium]|nr:sugar transferase [Candidatus Dormibacteraeota bacterium]